MVRACCPCDGVVRAPVQNDAMAAERADLSCSIYTQITDVELECDGYFNYDRTSKFNAEQTAAIYASNQRLIWGGDM
jgi:hypothetical protein